MKKLFKLNKICIKIYKLIDNLKLIFIKIRLYNLDVKFKYNFYLIYV